MFAKDSRSMISTSEAKVGSLLGEGSCAKETLPIPDYYLIGICFRFFCSLLVCLTMIWTDLVCVLLSSSASACALTMIWTDLVCVLLSRCYLLSGTTSSSL